MMRVFIAIPKLCCTSSFASYSTQSSHFTWAIYSNSFVVFQLSKCSLARNSQESTKGDTFRSDHCQIVAVSPQTLMRVVKMLAKIMMHETIIEKHDSVKCALWWFSKAPLFHSQLYRTLYAAVGKWWLEGDLCLILQMRRWWESDAISNVPRYKMWFL